ncbi:MAG: hypothetical protein K6C94_06245, partial [Candidatus Gastranaerophilales bacterium]|nr:hypothetical protein [Candidatus Gastranaerophilales bacterium]
AISNAITGAVEKALDRIEKSTNGEVAEFRTSIKKIDEQRYDVTVKFVLFPDYFEIQTVVPKKEEREGEIYRSQVDDEHIY